MVSALFPIPKIALVPLFIIWFGIGEAPKVAIITMGVSFPLYLNVYAGIRGVDAELIEAGESLGLSRWVLVTAILVMVVVLGFFLPPVSIILMTAPIILPPLRAAQFDLVWFGVVMTIVMELGLIHPPVGLNLFVIKNIAPDIPLRDVVWGVMPFVVLMILAVIVLCIFPEIATWFSDLVMGRG